MKKCSATFAIILLGLLPSLAFSQQDTSSFNTLLKKLKTNHLQHPREKIHLHLDKPYYAADDIIWFKAYIISTVASQPSAISGIIYVELVDGRDSVQQQLKLPVISGVSWGSFQLPDSIAEGNYRIRAYTRWMRNAGPEFFFDKTIRIGNLHYKHVATFSKPKTITKKSVISVSTAKTDVQFFPEGGSFVAGLTGKVGLKAVAPNGLGEDVTGRIVADDGKTAAVFRSAHLGMGSFLFTPMPGRTYIAKIKTSDSAELTVSLPQIATSGFQLAVDQDTANIRLKIAMSADLMGKGELKIIAQHNGEIYFAGKTKAHAALLTELLPRSQFPSGILQLTLFSADNLPVCERLIFVNNPADHIITKLSSIRKSYKVKEPIALELQTGLNNQPLQGTFSIAVTNTTAVSPDELNESNVFTTMLLTSDLSGYIEKPNYYFQDNSEQTQRDLDNLLLTQGWRRLRWEMLGKPDRPDTWQPEKHLGISGTVTTHGGKAIAGCMVLLRSPVNSSFQKDTLSDLQGRFKFDSLVFIDGAKFNLQAFESKSKTNFEVRPDSISGAVVAKNKNTGDIAINVNDSMSVYLNKSERYFEELEKEGKINRVRTLQEVKVVEKKNFAKNSSNLNGPGNADYVFSGDQLKNCLSLPDCLQGRVAGLTFKNGRLTLLHYGQEVVMEMIVDGVVVDPASIQNYSPFDIQAVEVLTDLSKTAIYGRQGVNSGVLIITSKRGGDDKATVKEPMNSVEFSPKGYPVSREFYSPVYQHWATDDTPDHRTTIYWNPNIISSKEGKATINYANSGDPGIYRVVVEGMDMQGNLSHTVYTYQVMEK